MFTPERYHPTPGQHGHSPHRHTAAGTATPTIADMGNTIPQRANPTTRGLQVRAPAPTCRVGTIRGTNRGSERQSASNPASGCLRGKDQTQEGRTHKGPTHTEGARTEVA